MKFSVIIPVYNGEGHLRGAVETLLSQDFADFEVVIVDDGSTDATLALGRSLAAEDSRIRVVHQENGGVSVARNRGMDEARGEWIAWLDADDAYAPGALRRIAEIADAHAGCSCLQFPYLEIQPDGLRQAVIPPAYSIYGDREHSGVEAFDVLYARLNVSGLNWQPWRFVFRRDSLPRFRAGVIHEDMDVLPLHMAKFPKVFISKEAFYEYLPAREGAATAVVTPNAVRDIMDVTAHVYGDLGSSGLSEDLRRGFRSTLAVNLFGYYLASAGFAKAERDELLGEFAAHRDWLLAIEWPVRTAWLKRLLIRVLGVRGAARLVGWLTSYRGWHGGRGR